MIVVMMLPCTWVVCPTHQHPPVSQPAPFSVGEHNQIYLTLSFNVTLWQVRIHHISASLMLRNQWLLICFIVLYPCVWTAYPFQPNQPAGVPCINGWGLGCPGARPMEAEQYRRFGVARGVSVQPLCEHGYGVLGVQTCYALRRDPLSNQIAHTGRRRIGSASIGLMWPLNGQARCSSN